MTEKRPEERTPMDDWNDIETIVRNRVTGPVAREARTWWKWNVEPRIAKHESKIMMGIAVGFVLFCLALAL
jgi:hypothetical protein